MIAADTHPAGLDWFAFSSLMVIWVSAPFLAISRLQHDVRTADPEAALVARPSNIPFHSRSVYSIHRKLFPKSKLRKLLAFVVFFTPFAALITLL
jgi:hypothetical protein